MIFVYIKVVISTSQLLHINDFMTFPFVTSYFGRVTMEIFIKACGLTIGEVVYSCYFSCLTMTGYQGMVGSDISYDFIGTGGHG